MVKGALFRQKGKMLMIAFTIALGASLATAMLSVMLDVGDKVNRELKTYGANINVIPKSVSLLGDLYGLEETETAFLKESELGNIKTIFWAFNIVDFTPYLDVDALLDGHNLTLVGTWFSHHLETPTGESLDTGMKSLKNWWDVTGAWLTEDDNGVMVGSLVAEANTIALGDKIFLTVAEKKQEFEVKGIFSAGSDEDECIFANLNVVQSLISQEDAVSRVEVSALTTPDNELSRRAAQNPNGLSVKEWETWYCTAYVSAISYQIQEVITDSVVKPIRQVAESEGAILEKTQLLMLLITILSLAGSALGISNLVTASVMERSREIGLMKAVGAQNSPISLLILTEILFTAVLGGIVGYFLGLGFAQIIGHTIFGSAIALNTTVIPLVAVLVFVVTLAGSIPSIRMLLSLRPAEVLHGGH
jgi:putative ABC transport system permease protein